MRKEEMKYEFKNKKQDYIHRKYLKGWKWHSIEFFCFLVDNQDWGCVRVNEGGYSLWHNGSWEILNGDNTRGEKK